MPLPERELGIAADVAALGFVFYAIVTPRLELERRAIAGAPPAYGVPAPAPADRPANPASPFLGDNAPGFVEDADAAMRRAFPNGFDMNDPEHVARLNAIAASIDTTAGIEVSGDAVGGSPVRSMFPDGALADSANDQGAA